MNDTPGFNRVLIANRGEIALRAIRVCHRLGLEAVAVYSTADAASPHVWAADRAVCIGPPAAQDSYLAIPSLLHVANETGCDAVYPGYGFLAENADFADRCAKQGMKFIGPSVDTIAIMGDKSRARALALAHGVPVVPGSDGAYVDADAAFSASKKIDYPVVLKARSGGGGRGMRVVNQVSEFASAFVQASREAEAAFADGAVYVERFFHTVRHIEVQVLGDGKGGVVVFDERDCSVQRRHQKLIEESPSPSVLPGLRQHLLDAAAQLTRGIGYEGAGTVEFILSVLTGEFFFIEMNTRIQVEHPVTEMRTGVDLVRAQFDIAAGKPLLEHDASSQPGGHAIEFRINAEDWRHDFQPTPGILNRWCLPTGNGVRVDTAAFEGQCISPFYDSMIARLIVHGTSREDALRKARHALARFDCQGVATTVDFHLMIVNDEAFIGNAVHTRWIETEWSGRKEGRRPT